MTHDNFGRVNAPPPDGTQGATCACGAYYLDYPDGHVAHEIVHGHRSRASAGQPTNPAGRGTSPTKHQPAAPRRVDDVSPEMPGPLDADSDSDSLPYAGARDLTTDPGHDTDPNDDRR